jgi:2'-5' RNA ligase
VIRAFVAISIPEQILEKIGQTVSQLQQLKLDARFTKRSSIHLTLKFLGNVREIQVDDISEALRLAAETATRFEISVQGLGVFPTLRRPRIVWVGIRREPLLADLHRNMDKNLDRLGFEPEKREFRPHLTLARLKSSRNTTELKRFLADEGSILSCGSFQVREIDLYQSILHPSGAEYRKLATHSLPGSRSVCR